MSARLLDRLGARAEDPAPFLTFLDRRWSRREIWEEANAAAAGFRAADLEPGRPIGILLPNLPGAVVALLGIWLAGRPATLVDGRRAIDALHGWAEATRPAALVTLDLASVFERARALAEAHPPCRLIVMPIADQLSFWKRMISPWLRGGGTAKRPEDTEILAWQALLKQHSPAGAAAGEPPDLPSVAPWPDRANGLLACPLADPAALSALVSAWCGDGGLILSPRLDERSLAKVRKASRPELEIVALSEQDDAL